MKKYIEFTQDDEGFYYIVFVLKGKKGAVDLVVKTDWYIVDNKIQQRFELCGVGYHSPKKYTTAI